MNVAAPPLGAARLGDQVSHGVSTFGMLGGALAGAAAGAAMVTATAATGGLALFAIVGGCVAGGGVAGGALTRGIIKAMDLPDPTTGLITGLGSPNVFINGRPAIRAGIDMAACNGLMGSNHYPLPAVPLAEGSSTVFVNGFPMGRVSMKLACGGAVKTGRPNVIIGGPTVAVGTVISAEAILETGLQLLGFGALGAGAIMAAATGGALALGKFVGIAGAFAAGFDGLHHWGDSLGPGGGDILTGLAGFGLLLGGVIAGKPPGERDPTWNGTFWADNINDLPKAERTIEVNAANIRATEPEYLAKDHEDWPNGAWRWSLYDGESNAKFCEVYSPTVDGDPKVAKGGPELWLHTKQAQLPSGERVAVKAQGFRFTDEAMKQGIDAHTNQFGQPPTNLGGDLSADNLGVFQQSYDQLRTANPGWTHQQLANEAVRATSFAKTREKLNYGDFRVDTSEPTGTGTFKGQEFKDVPTEVRVEALPSSKAGGEPEVPSSAQPGHFKQW